MRISRWLISLVLVCFFCFQVQAQRVNIGDQIQINLPGEVNLNQTFQVNKKGRILVPEIGLITVAGLSEKRLAARIKSKLAEVYRDVKNVQIYIAQRQITLMIQGYVVNPGEYTLPHDATIQMAFSAAGGVRNGARIDRVQLKRKNKKTIFNYKRFLDSGDSSQLPTLRSMDTIFVPASSLVGNVEQNFTAGAQHAGTQSSINVLGAVNTPRAFPFDPKISLVDIIMLAGGVTPDADINNIRIIVDEKPTAFDLKAYLDSGKKDLLPALQAGATVYIPKLSKRASEEAWFELHPEQVVRVIGAVMKPGRVEWSDRVDLIDILAHVGGPKANADTSRIEIVNKDKITGHSSVRYFDFDQYISAGNRGITLPKISAGAIIRVHEQKSPSGDKSEWVKQSSADSIYLFGQVNAPGRYRFTPKMHFLDILAAANGPTTSADIHQVWVSHRDKSHAHVSHFNLSLYFETGDESILPKITMGDTIYIPDKNRSWLDRPKESTIRVLGAVSAPGRYLFDDSMTILDLLAQAGGPSESADIENISIMNMSCCEGQARVFDLRDFSKTADLTHLPLLRTGDTIYIPSRRDKFAEKVRLGMTDVLQVLTLYLLIGTL